MATIKSYTDLNQSKKLAEILPLESADMFYNPRPSNEIPCVGNANMALLQVPCWSLTALLEILDYPQLSKDKLDNGKEGWMVSVYPNNCRYDSCWYYNPIDACMAIIEKLHELNLL